MLSRQRKPRQRKKMVTEPNPLLLPKNLRRLQKVVPKNAAEAAVAARAKTAAVDCAEEDENEKVPERTAVRLDLCLDHGLPPRRCLGPILRRPPIRRRRATIPGNAGEEEKIQSATAKSSNAGPRPKATIRTTRWTNYLRINGRFLSLSWS